MLSDECQKINQSLHICSEASLNIFQNQFLIQAVLAGKHFPFQCVLSTDYQEIITCHSSSFTTVETKWILHKLINSLV